MAERRGSGLQSRLHGFESRTHLGENHGFRKTSGWTWAIGAAVARFPDTEEVTGSIPVSPTKQGNLLHAVRPAVAGAYFTCGRSSAGRAPPCQGGCREFESRRPLAGPRHGEVPRNRRLHGGLAERRGSGLQSRIHGFESRTHLGENHGFRVIPDKHGRLAQR